MRYTRIHVHGATRVYMYIGEDMHVFVLWASMSTVGAPMRQSYGYEM